MILPGRENPRNCVDPNEMKMRWCLSTMGYPGWVLPIAQSTSVTPVSLYTRRHSLTMYWEAVLKRVWRYTWMPRSSELRDALGGGDRASVEMHWEAVIEWGWRCNMRPRLSGLRDALGGCDWASGIGWLGGRHDGSWDSIHWLTCNCGNVESWVQQHLPRDGKLAWSGDPAGIGRLSIVGWCCTWCLLYSVLGHDHGMGR